MFENTLVDAFSRTPYQMVPLLFTPAAAWMVYLSRISHVGWLTTVGLAVAGFVWWTFLEYWLHRTLFHWTPKAAWGERFHFILHGVHHELPHDRYRLVFPAALSLGLFAVFFAIHWVALGTSAFAFHAGMTVGYMTYDLTHYYVHHGRAQSGRMRRLRQHHILHHFKAGHVGKFGVSTTLWDRVFGTLEMRPAVEAKSA